MFALRDATFELKGRFTLGGIFRAVGILQMQISAWSFSNDFDHDEIMLTVFCFTRQQKQKQINVYKKMADRRKAELEFFMLSMLRRKEQTEEYRKKMRAQNLFMERQEKGDRVLVKDLRLCDAEYFYKTFRITVKIFEELHT